MRYSDTFYFSLIMVALVIGCSAGSGDDQVGYYPPYIENEHYTNAPLAVSSSYDTYSEIAPTVYHVNSQGASSVHFSLDNLDGHDVYFVFTNTNFDSYTLKPTVTSTSIAGSSLAAAASSMSTFSDEEERDGQENLRMGTPKIEAFNATVELGLRKSEGELEQSIFNGSAEIFLDSVGDICTFYGEDSSDKVAATCRKVVPDIHGITLNVWVANDAWGTTVTETSVATLACAFLQAGSDNDIYEWVTNILGEPWGSHGYSNLIGDDNTITILLYDILSDGVLGYYYARDNFKKTSQSDSNERLIFYLDSSYYSTCSDDIISTMAHEFQHMIHFYQKRVLLAGSGSGSETWMNEMCSLMTEDLVAKKLGLEGPRGVVDAGAGSSGNTSGRLPLYVSQNYTSFIDWCVDTGSVDYSTSYACGAFLLRNYGSAEFLRNIVHNSYTDYRAVAAAVYASGARESFATAIRKWGAAALISDYARSNVPSGYLYNNGDAWLESSYGSLTYSLGSINMDNYTGAGSTGMYLYNASTYSSASSLEEGANLSYLAGSALSGNYSWDVELASGVYLTVVIKP